MKQKHDLLFLCITVEPCIMDHIDHFWGRAVPKPIILSKRGSNMTLGRWIGLQHIKRSAS